MKFTPGFTPEKVKLGVFFCPLQSNTYKKQVCNYLLLYMLIQYLLFFVFQHMQQINSLILYNNEYYSNGGFLITAVVAYTDGLRYIKG
ncbi:hypothetical protein D0T87_12925 [Bacteroides sp. 51]|nr:hypothetical protein [Bacteroides sp. 51]